MQFKGNFHVLLEAGCGFTKGNNCRSINVNNDNINLCWEIKMALFVAMCNNNNTIWKCLAVEVIAMFTCRIWFSSNSTFSSDFVFAFSNNQMTSIEVRSAKTFIQTSNSSFRINQSLVSHAQLKTFTDRRNQLTPYQIIRIADNYPPPSLVCQQIIYNAPLPRSITSGC